MADEEKNEVIEEQEKTDPTQKYIETIQKMRETMVNKEEYDRLMKENKQLLETVVNGGKYEQEKTKAELTASINDLRKKIRNSEEMSNLEFAKATLELREQVLERDKKDIFVAAGSKYRPEPSDYAAAQRVAEVFQDCIDVADGDSDIFTRELMRRTAG